MSRRHGKAWQRPSRAPSRIAQLGTQIEAKSPVVELYIITYYTDLLWLEITPPDKSCRVLHVDVDAFCGSGTGRHRHRLKETRNLGNLVLGDARKSVRFPCCLAGPTGSVWIGCRYPGSVGERDGSPMCLCLNREGRLPAAGRSAISTYKFQVMEDFLKDEIL